MKKKYKSISAYLCTFLMVSLPFHNLYAQDAITEAGQEGQSFADQLIQNYNAGTDISTGDRIYIPTMTDGEFSWSADNENFSVQELYPGTSGTAGDSSQYFSDVATPNITDLQDVSNDGNDMNQLGDSLKAQLYSDAISDTPTVTGDAYSTMVGINNLSTPDLSNDPALDVSREIANNIDTISEEFGDCSTSTVFTNITNTEHIPDYRTCNRIVDRTSTCTVEHDYTAGVVAHHSGPYNIMPDGEGAILVWIGEVGNNYWNGRCDIFERVTEVEIVNRDAIQQVVLTQATWDDYMQVYVGPEGDEELVWFGPDADGTFPPETDGVCDRETSWNRNLNIDITDQFLNNTQNGDVVRFLIRVSVSGGGEGYARLRITYDADEAVTTDEWSPQECIAAAEGIYDGVASGSVTCSRMPTAAIGTGCVNINGVDVCNDDLGPSPFPDIDPICEQVTVDAVYDFYHGEFCYTDANGNEVCEQTGPDGDLDTCQEFEDGGECGFINNSCLVEADDGTCYLWEEVWDCGEDIDIDDVQVDTEIDCEGPIRCMGDDCLTPNRTESQSFNTALTSLHAVQFLTMDMNCPEIDGTTDVNCTVFTGEALECKIAVGGAQDCCDLPTNTSPRSYLETMLSMGTMVTSAFGLETGDTVMGAYHDVHDGAVDGLSSVLEPFTSYSDNIAGLTVTLVENYYTNVFIDWLKDQIREVISDMLRELMADAATDMAADAGQAALADAAQSQAQEAATNQLASAAASALGVVSAVYTAYVVAMMVIQAIYECEEPEFILSSKRDIHACHYVGSYCASEVAITGTCIERREAWCCYNSPLSRIINEQIQLQSTDPNPYGSARNPQCGGLDLSEIQDIDWSQIDLGEWEALLAQHDILPDPADMDLESITGNGNVLNRLSDDPDGRGDASERTYARFGDADIDEIRRDLGDSYAVDVQGNYSEPRTYNNPIHNTFIIGYTAINPDLMLQTAAQFCRELGHSGASGIAPTQTDIGGSTYTYYTGSDWVISGSSPIYAVDSIDCL